MPFDQPDGVVDLLEGERRLAQLLDGLEGTAKLTSYGRDDARDQVGHMDRYARASNPTRVFGHAHGRLSRRCP